MIHSKDYSIWFWSQECKVYNLHNKTYQEKELHLKLLLFFFVEVYFTNGFKLILCVCSNLVEYLYTLIEVIGKGEIAIELASVLRKKGIVVHEFENVGREYRDKWVHAFSDSQFDQHKYLSEFLWYMFSAEKVDYLVRKEAALSFDKVNKRYCYIFFQESDDVLQVEYASSVRAKDLLNVTGEYCDVYVVDKGFNWTYVIPHEEDWGPYFYRKKSKSD